MHSRNGYFTIALWSPLQSVFNNTLFTSDSVRSDRGMMYKVHLSNNT